MMDSKEVCEGMEEGEILEGPDDPKPSRELLKTESEPRCSTPFISTYDIFDRKPLPEIGVKQEPCLYDSGNTENSFCIPHRYRYDESHGSVLLDDDMGQRNNIFKVYGEEECDSPAAIYTEDYVTETAETLKYNLGQWMMVPKADECGEWDNLFRWYKYDQKTRSFKKKKRHIRSVVNVPEKSSLTIELDDDEDYPHHRRQSKRQKQDPSVEGSDEKRVKNEAPKNRKQEAASKSEKEVPSSPEISSSACEREELNASTVVEVAVKKESINASAEPPSMSFDVSVGSDAENTWIAKIDDTVIKILHSPRHSTGVDAQAASPSKTVAPSEFFIEVEKKRTFPSLFKNNSETTFNGGRFPNVKDLIMVTDLLLSSTNRDVKIEPNMEVEEPDSDIEIIDEPFISRLNRSDSPTIDLTEFCFSEDAGPKTLLGGNSSGNVESSYEEDELANNLRDHLILSLWNCARRECLDRSRKSTDFVNEDEEIDFEYDENEL